MDTYKGQDGKISLAELEAYWKKQLGGELPVLEAPLDHPRPPVQSFVRKSETIKLDEALCLKLEEFYSRNNVTLFVTLLAALKSLFLRYTQQEDIIVGSVSCDSFYEEEGRKEWFANPVALRTNLAGDPSFRDLIRRVAVTVEDAIVYRDYPFERLVKHVNGRQDLSRAPIFQAMLVLCDVPFCITEAPTSEKELRDIREHIFGCDLAILVYAKQRSLDVRCDYDADLFDDGTITRMLRHFQILLEGIAANPEHHLSELTLLSAIERHQLLVEWNSTTAEYPKDHCLHQLFEAQVERSPDSIAMVFESKQLTYRELNGRANQVAHYLRKRGIRPEILVGICVERSLEMVVGILGILKAGGAYVPLDPTYPRERLALMLEDAEASVLLTQQRLMPALPKCEAHVVCLDADWDEIAQECRENLASGVTAENLAYLIFTSGSTGQPKGVLISHYNVARLFEATQDWFNFNDRDVWTLFHSYAFDFSVWELWGALLHGGRLVVVPYLMSRSPEEFYDLLCREQVTILNQTPSAFRQLMQVDQSFGAAKELALRLVIFGGEALEVQSLEPWFDRHGDEHPRLINMYGITETTVHVTYRRLTAADLNAASRSVIGRPISDLQVYVLDQQRRPVPIGVPGEIYVGGAGLARGYLNNPELTAERFVPDPFSNDDRARLYKTGDLARYLPDGDIEYLGRSDHQVKIRGFRIELGEIEAVLAQHLAVRDSVVVAREDEPGDKRLVAYLVARQEQEPAINELRTFLKQQLPEYMVPSAFVMLNEIPLTPNGKVDRRALPESLNCCPNSETEYLAPRTGVEQKIAAVWQEALEAEKVGINDNFFDLGGHSLMMMQVHSKLRKSLDVDLSIIKMYQHPTISSLAKYLSEESSEEASYQDVRGRAKRQKDALARQKKLVRR